MVTPLSIWIEYLHKQTKDKTTNLVYLRMIILMCFSLHNIYCSYTTVEHICTQKEHVKGQTHETQQQEMI